MPVTSSMVKVYIRDRVRDRDLENGLYEPETETETLESRDTRDETRVSSVSVVTTGLHVLLFLMPFRLFHPNLMNTHCQKNPLAL